MPNFESLRVFEQRDYRLIVTVPEGLTADQAARPEDHPELDPDFDPKDYYPDEPNDEVKDA
jgi:hypothetical protein